MAKRKKPTKRELKQQRRKALERVRQEQGWESRPASEPLPWADTDPPGQDVFMDMLPLFPQVGRRSGPSPADTERFLGAVVESDRLADEPELEQVYIQPMRCLETYLRIGAQRGLDSAPFDDMPEKERDEILTEILNETIHQLLDDELHQRILAGVDELRQRWKQEGRSKKVAQAAAVWLALNDTSSPEMWPMIGLVHAITRRSLSVGFEMLAASEGFVEELEAVESNVPLLQRLVQSDLGQRAEHLLEQFPGLSGFLAQESDRVWDAGMDALFYGRLNLGLFSLEELAHGFELFRDLFRPGESKPVEAGGELLPDETQERATAFVMGVERYLKELLTPERVNQVQRRLDAALHERATSDPWLPLIVLLAEDLNTSDVETARPLLMRAFLGEMKALSNLEKMDRHGDEESG